MNKYEYVLTLNTDQTKEVLKSVELLMRLKLGQYKEIPFALLDISKDNFCEKKDIADPYLASAFEAMMSDKKDKGDWKDTEWYRLYNLYQVLRKALHDAENPEGKGIDGYDPIQFTEEPLPKIRWEKYEKFI